MNKFDRKIPFAFFTDPIIHLVYPPKFLPKNCFNLSWDACKSQEKLKTMLMETFWGENEMYYGIVKTVNKKQGRRTGLQGWKWIAIDF